VENRKLKISGLFFLTIIYQNTKTKALNKTLFSLIILVKEKGIIKTFLGASSKTNWKQLLRRSV